MSGCFATVFGRSASATSSSTDGQILDPGYRAVHVIAKVDNIPVEVQFRTELQDLWAQVFERLADGWGRQIRYGGEPDPDVRSEDLSQCGACWSQTPSERVTTSRRWRPDLFPNDSASLSVGTGLRPRVSE